MGDQVFGVLQALGIRVRKVPDLEEGALYFSDNKLLLIDVCMDDEEISDALDQLLSQVWS